MGLFITLKVLLCCSHAVHVVFSDMVYPFHCHSTRFIIFLGIILHTPGPLNPVHLTDNRKNQSKRVILQAWLQRTAFADVTKIHSDLPLA